MVTKDIPQIGNQRPQTAAVCTHLHLTHLVHARSVASHRDPRDLYLEGLQRGVKAQHVQQIPPHVLHAQVVLQKCPRRRRLAWHPLEVSPPSFSLCAHAATDVAQSPLCVCSVPNFVKLWKCQVIVYHVCGQRQICDLTMSVGRGRFASAAACAAASSAGPSNFLLPLPCLLPLSLPLPMPELWLLPDARTAAPPPSLALYSKSEPPAASDRAATTRATACGDARSRLAAPALPAASTAAATAVAAAACIPAASAAWAPSTLRLASAASAAGCPVLPGAASAAAAAPVPGLLPVAAGAPPGSRLLPLLAPVLVLAPELPGLLCRHRGHEGSSDSGSAVQGPLQVIHCHVMSQHTAGDEYRTERQMQITWHSTSLSQMAAV